MVPNKPKDESDRLNCLLKSPIGVVQKAAAPKNGVKIFHKFIVAVRCSLAMSYNEGFLLEGSFPLNVQSNTKYLPTEFL